MAFDPFYFLAIPSLLAAIGAMTLKNMVHAVLAMIACFIGTAGLFVLLDAAFFSMIVIIVYVGAIAVLFLFVVMMIEIPKQEHGRMWLQRLLAGVLGLLVFVSLSVGFWEVQGERTKALEDRMLELGRVLYTTYSVPFLLSALVLVVAMIGAVALDGRRPMSSRKAVNVATQLARRREDVVTLCSVKSGEGVD